MSEYERNKGLLTKVCEVKDLTEEMCKSIVNEELPNWYDSYMVYFKDEYLDFNHFFIDGCIWFLEREKVDNDPEFCNVTKLENGSIAFESYHYNGGAHWTELLDGKLG